MFVKDLYSELARQLATMVDELEAYVVVESGSADKEGIDRVGALLTEAFRTLGFEIERVQRENAGDHLVARRAGGGRGHLLALIHLDTVWPRGTLADNPFRVEAGRAYGPGVADMKGGWVVLLSALRVLRDLNWDALEAITVFMTADEEHGSPTARPHIERAAADADWVVVMEPARENGALVVQRGMVGAVYFDIAGLTAHTGHGDRGASAIEELSHKVLALQSLTDTEQEVLVNVGIVQGGSARQVVPDRAWASIDVRAPSSALAERVMKQIDAIADRQCVPGTTTVRSGGITRPAFERNAGTDRLLELARQCGRELGIDIQGAATRAGSDGNFTAALGVPTLDGLGPEAANVCSRDEFVEVESLPRRAALLAGVITALPT